MCRAPGFGFGLVRDDPSSVVIESVGQETGELVIPEEVCFEGEVRVVREIGSNAFKGARFTKVIFPRTLEIVGPSAFEGNPDLAEVVFPQGSKLCRICSCAFSLCPKLTTVVFDPATPLEVIENSCFDGCDLKGAFVLPKATRWLGSWAFRGNRGLSAFLFADDSWLATIRAHCFAGTAIERLELPRYLAEIGQWAFAEMTRLKHCELTFEHPLTCFQNSPFMGTKIREIRIPDSVTEIRAGAFADVAKLEAVHFSPCSQLAIVGTKAFAGTSLVSIVLPVKVELMESEVFAGCGALIEIRFEAGSCLKSVADSTFARVKPKTLALPAANCIQPVLFEGFDNGMNLDFVTPVGDEFHVRAGMFGAKRFNVRFPRDVMKRANKERTSATFVFA
jgi:hypothetical protein